MTIKVCLVNPGKGKLTSFEKLFIPPPLNLAYISSVIKPVAKSFIIDTYAEELTVDQCSKRILKENPDIVAVIPNDYCDYMIPEFQSWCNILNRIKKEDIITLVSGIEATIYPRRILDNKNVDIVIRGEVEVTFQKLLENFENINNGPFLRKIDGISYRINNEIIHNKKRELLRNLDELPFPSRELLKTKIYRHIVINNPFTTLLTSRGCLFNCVFCSRPVYGKYRERSAENILEELREIRERHNLRDIIIYDDIFTFNKKRVEKICELIKKEKLDLNWVCATRVDLINKELLLKMKEAGCSTIAFGVESGSEKILKNIKKNISMNQIFNAFKLTKNIGIETITYMLLGNPNETRETINKSFELILKLSPDYVQFNPVVIYPGSEMYEKRGENFHDFSNDELEEIQKILYKKYYFRMNNIMNQIKKIRSFNDLLKKIENLRLLL